MDDIVALTEAAKLLLADGLGWGRDGAHVHAGMIVFITGLLLSRGHRPGLAFLALLVLELVNEVIDLHFFTSMSHARVMDSAKDMVTTLLGPALLWITLYLSARYADAGEAGETTSQDQRA